MFRFAVPIVMKETGRKLACEITAGFKAFLTRSLRAAVAGRNRGGATMILKVAHEAEEQILAGMV